MVGTTSRPLVMLLLGVALLLVFGYGAGLVLRAADHQPVRMDGLAVEGAP